MPEETKTKSSPYKKLKLPPGSFKAYLFDCDGTIADSMPLHYIAWKQALGEHGCEFPEDIFYAWGGMPAAEIGPALGHAAEAVDSVPMLASAARDGGLATPALDGLAALVEGRIEPEQWTATVTAPALASVPRPVRAA